MHTHIVTCPLGSNSVDSNFMITVKLLGGALGGVVCILIIASFVLIMVIIFLGRELRKGQRKLVIIKSNHDGTERGKQTTNQHLGTCSYSFDLLCTRYCYT